MIPRLAAGDAVGNHVIAIHEQLLEWGYESYVFACEMDEYGKRFARHYSGYREFMDRDDVLIYHYCLYCDNYLMFQETRNRKVLVYHNITPEDFFRGYSADSYHLCRLGRELLPRLRDCDLALGVSEYNRRELVAMGFPEERTGVLPISPPLRRLDGVPEDTAVARRIADGSVVFLHVGRVVPNKRIEDLLRFFSAYRMGVNARSRLVLAGALEISAYHNLLLSLVDELGLEGRVLFLGKVSDAALKSCYLHSHYYISMSEHEGFCVPLLESFHFGLPVLAYAAGAVPETMGGAGILFDRKDFPLLAELVNRLQRDPLLRERIVEAQRRRLEDFGPETFARRLREALRRVLGEPAGEAEEKEDGS